MAEMISNAGRLGAPDGTGNPLCAAVDSAVNLSRQRLWLAVPWVYTRTNNPWLLDLIQRIAAKAADVDVRVYLRPDQNNSYAVATWLEAGVKVVQSTTRTRYLHSKVIVSDDAALILTANLTDTDLFRNTNHLSIERNREQVEAAAASLLLLEEETPDGPIAAEFASSDTLVPLEIRRHLGVERLNPMQAGAIPKVLHQHDNLVIAAPTGAGKTLVAEVALLQEALDRRKTGVYLAPMRAIAAEKREDWQRLEAAGVRVYKTTGEDDAFDPSQALNAQIIVATPEKWDSVSRRQLSQELVSRIGVIVIDEVHLVDDDNRGPGLEALLARINLAFPAARLIAMSGTLANADAIARWLNADLYESTWRPIALTTVVIPYPRAGTWREDEDLRNALAAPVVQETVEDDGAVLVFCGSRKGVEGCASHLAQALGIEAPESRPRVQNVELGRALAAGVGFHHAGLHRDDRATVEQLFRSGAIKVLVATSTMAAGVNLPARVVIVRDLTLGVDEISSSELLQMAGRAGRPGLETQGFCYVLSPTEKLGTVQQMLEGRPIGSHIGDDLATHINTEIVLGIIRSRSDDVAWYQRTLHAHLGDATLDPGHAVDALVQGGFARERGEVLEPADLGRATSDLMIRVPTATALESWLAKRGERTADPTALEVELLTAACGSPLEFADLPSRVDENELYESIKRGHRGTTDWGQGRLRYFAVASSVLSGLRADALPLENASSVVGAVQREVPRFLRFLARRADEREPGAPDVAVAAADLAAALEFGTAERGSGCLLEALKRAFQPDESRRRKVLDEYARLRARGVNSVEDALPLLAARSQDALEQRPKLEPGLAVDGGQLVVHAGRSRRPARVHTRIVTPHREIIHRTETASLATVELVPVAQLGRAGKLLVSVELVAGVSSGLAWAYANCSGEIDVAAPPIDLDGAERALRDRLGTEYDSTPAKGFFKKIGKAVFGASALTEAQQQIQEAPPRVKKAATVLARGLAAPQDKAMAVRALLQQHTRMVASGRPRPLSLIADATDVTFFEAATLGTALLRYMGVEAQLISAHLDNEDAALCTWRHQGQWYGLPIWPARHVRVDGATRVQEWTDDAERGSPPAVGWEVLRSYERLTARSLPFTLADVAANGRPAQNGRTGATSAANVAPAPLCPVCHAPMHRRTGRFGPFWGCSGYPSCKGTRQLPGRVHV